MSRSRKSGGIQFTPAEIETAESLANDVAEGIDNGESRRKLRRAVQYFALQHHYERQARLLAESRLTMVRLGVELINSAFDKPSKGKPCRNTKSK